MLNRNASLARMFIAAAAATMALGSARAQPAPDPIAPVLTVQNPRRIADLGDGQLIVSDRRFGAIIAVDKSTLEPVWSFTLANETQPFGLAMLKKTIFVGNTDTKNVEMYRTFGRGADTTLKFIGNLGGAPEGAIGDIGNPVSIAVDSNLKLIFVLDAAAKTIKVFDDKGRAVDAFQPADGAGQVMSPVAIAVDESRGELLVADYGGATACSVCPSSPGRILGYSYNGAFRFQINGDSLVHSSPDKIGFKRVQGLAAKPDGRIFAVDPLGSRIFVLDRSSALIDVLGGEGSAPGELMLPLDLMIDAATGDIFISNNRGARRIEVMRGAGG